MNREGGTVYVSNGFLYLKNNVYKGKINLRCQVHSSGCSGTGYIEHGKFLEGKQHMHPQQFEKFETFRIESRIKTESEKSPLAPRDIYNKNLDPNNEGLQCWQNKEQFFCFKCFKMYYMGT